MERKKLNAFSAYPNEHDDFEGIEVYDKAEADAVMDAMEAKIKGLEYNLHLANKRIKELENEVQHRKEVQESLNFELSRRSSRIKELEETHNLEECPFRSENRELKNRIKELESQLGTELGTRLGTDHIVDVNKMMWVSVKERLPEECEPVLGYNAENNEYVVVWMEDVNGISEWSDGNFNWTIDSFTHWMPLPVPPKEEK